MSGTPKLLALIVAIVVIGFDLDAPAEPTEPQRADVPVVVRRLTARAEPRRPSFAYPSAARPFTVTRTAARLTVMPVAGAKTSGFGTRDDPFRRGRRQHAGIDIGARKGTPVLAAGAGEVVFAGWMNGYGRIVIVDHGGALTTRYAHLSKVYVRKGAPVAAGERLGAVGATGRATGPHLHFEVRRKGRPTHPLKALSLAPVVLAGR